MNIAASESDRLTTAFHRVARRRERPEWLNPTNISFALGILGGISYVTLYGFCASFASRFGTSPEEIGLSQTTLVVRVAIFGLISLFLGSVVLIPIALIVTLASAIWRWIGRRRTPRFDRLPGRRRDADHANRQEGPDAGVNRRTRILASVCAAVVAVTSVLVEAVYEEDWEWYSGIVLIALLFIGFYVFFRLIASWHHSIAVLALLLLIFALALRGGFAVGAAVAEGVITEHRTDFSFRYATGLEPEIVCIVWAPDSTLPGAPDEGIYLGRANGVSLISDGQRLFRVYDGQVQAMVAPLPEDGATACPSATQAPSD